MKTMNKTVKNQYDPSTIELKWQAKWEKEGTYHPDLKTANGSATLPAGRQGSPQGPFYNLMMFPYPSAEGMHAGNFFAFTGADTYGRFKRMQGYDVFEPIGLDGFGIHSENYAIKVGSHPIEQSKKSEDNFYRQFRLTGNMFDYRRTVETYKPDYYKWTQWVFTKLFKSGLAYRKKSPVNFCPSCKTVLADEQVIDGKCERCASVVEKKNLEQWFFRITEYADRLLKNIDGLNWTEKVKIAQRNWIGRSEGAKIRFRIKESGLKNQEIEVFTTAIDTIYGVTFMVVSPEHPLVDEILRQARDDKKREIAKYIKLAKSKSEIERSAEGKEKTGVFSGVYALSPFNGEEVPVWIADYVLMGYGTGAIMAVPAHDARDYEFAKKFDLSIKPVVKPKIGDKEAEVSNDGFWDYSQIKTKFADKSELFDSGEFDGLSSREAKAKMLDFIEEKSFGERTANYHLRDWLISRQRYWGPPIPMIYCEFCAKKGNSWFTSDEAKKSSKGMGISNIKFQISNSAAEAAGWYPVEEKNLPVELPYVEDFKPLGTGVSPLATHPEFYEVKCPSCGGDARRETDVSDTFLDSSWYFLRYLATDWDDLPFPSVELAKVKSQKSKVKNEIENLKLKIGNSAQRAAWLPVTMYIGGAEHSVLHLLYARFITMVFKDLGFVEFEEPFARFYAHGLIIKDGVKMSKSKGNIVNPDEYIKKYGTDTMRMYLRFLAPFDQSGDFRDSGIEGMHRFLKKVWKLFSQQMENGKRKTENSADSLRMMHQTIKNVTEEMENLRFNTAIAHLMTWYNFLALRQRSGEAVSLEEAEVYLKLLAPFAPYMSEELYQEVSQVSRVQVPREEKMEEKARGILDTRGTRGAFQSIHVSPWPEYDEKCLVADTVKIPVQVNGKLRGTLEVAADDAENQAKIEELARSDANVSKFLEGKAVKKVIFIQGKILNFVI